MNIDAVTFRSIARRVLPRASSLSADDARTIIDVARLAAGVDFDADTDEQRLLHRLVHYAAALADISPDSVPELSPLPIDDEERHSWIARLAADLRPEVAELAYVIAYLVTVGDLELAPVESTLIDELRVALGISRERAADLAVTVSSMITPGVDLAPRAST